MSTEFMAVGRITGNSRTFQILPRVGAARVAKGALRAARLRLPVYTTGVFYKVYRILSALIPNTVMMWLART
jgi:hypothetical protein